MQRGRANAVAKLPKTGIWHVDGHFLVATPASSPHLNASFSHDSMCGLVEVYKIASPAFWGDDSKRGRKAFSFDLRKSYHAEEVSIHCQRIFAKRIEHVSEAIWDSFCKYPH
jgi:hypothetical protein